MMTDKDQKIVDTKAPVTKNKVSFVSLLAHFGSYLFNRNSDASSLSKDISALEAERARERAEEAAKRKEQELATKKDKQAHLAGELKSLTSHDERAKHLEQVSTKPNFSPTASSLITIMPEAARAIVAKTDSPTAKATSSAVHPVVLKPELQKVAPAPAISQLEHLKQVPAKVAPVQQEAPKLAAQPVVASADPKKHQQFLDKKNKAAQNLSAERIKHTKQILKSKIENRPWNPHNLVQVNLIKEHRSMFFNWQSKMLSMIFFVILTCLICVLAYGYLLILEKEKQSSNLYIFTNLDSINKQIAVVKKELDDKIVPFNDKLMYTGYMLDNHIYWTNFFQFLEQDTLADVYYSSGIDASVSGNVKGTNGLFEIWSIARDYNTISNQTKVFAKSKSAKVLAVDVSDSDSIAKSSSTVGLFPTDSRQAVRFKLKLTLDQRLFLRDK